MNNFQKVYHDPTPIELVLFCKKCRRQVKHKCENIHQRQNYAVVRTTCSKCGKKVEK